MFVPFAYAAPEFVGTPADVTLAQAAWDHAAACAGRVARTPPTVAIRRDLPDTDAGILGLAEAGPEGVHTLRLEPRSHASVLAHEIAHLWINQGPRALVEGLAGALTDCIQGRAESTFAHAMFRASDLRAMPELRAWNDPVSAGDLDRALDAYLASFRLFQAIGQVVPLDRLLAARDWPELRVMLESAGPAGRRLQTVLDGGAEVQRAALQDDDLDGVSALTEELTGSDPGRWDTDGDGWWDGAPVPRPVGTASVPRDGRPICLPMVPAGSDRVAVAILSRLVGNVGRTAPLGVGHAGMLVRWNVKWGDEPGGVLAIAEGENLVPNARCAMATRVTVRASENVPEGSLDPFAAALADVVAELAAQGLAPDPEFAWSVGGDSANLDVSRSEGVVRVPWAAVARNASAGAAARVARQAAAVAAFAMLDAPDRDDAAAAWVQATRGVYPLIDAHPGDAARWLVAARKCPGGWAGVARGECRP